jgi:hypothetical protein
MPLARMALRRLERLFGDYPLFRVQVESLEEISAQKIRSLVERKKS